MLDFYTRLAEQGTNDTKLRHKTAKATRRVGDIRLHLGQAEQAIEAYQHAVALYQELIPHTPSNVDLTAELAGVYNALGQAYLKSNQRDKAKQAHKDAARTLTSVPKTAAGTPKISYELARTYYNLGKFPPEKGPPFTKNPFGGPPPGKGSPPGPKQPDGPPSDKGPPPEPKSPDGPPTKPESNPFGPKQPGGFPKGGPPPWGAGPDDAGQYLNKAIQLLEGLKADHPTVPAYRHLLALCYREKSTRPVWPPSKTGSTDRQKAIQLLGQLVTEFHNVPDYRFDLSATLALAATGKNKEAVKDMEAALDLLKELVSEHPHVPDYQFAKADMHMKLALMHDQNKKLDLATEELRQALKTHNGLIKLVPNATGYQLTRAKVQEALVEHLMKDKNWKDSRTELETAVDQLKALAAKEEKKMPFLNFMLANQYDKLATVLHELKEPALEAQMRAEAEKVRALFKGPPGHKHHDKGMNPKDKK
jgi:tetratricopeptide (TPR) repeat protein